MTLLDSSSSASVAADGHVEARFGDRATRLHPQWLREQSTEPGQIEATNRQRLFTPLDVELGLVAVDAELDGDTLTVAFSDGHRCRLPVAALIQRLGWVADPEAPPAPIAWAPGAAPFPTVSWPAIAGGLDEPGVAERAALGQHGVAEVADHAVDIEVVAANGALMLDTIIREHDLIPVLAQDHSIDRHSHLTGKISVSNKMGVLAVHRHEPLRHRHRVERLQFLLLAVSRGVDVDHPRVEDPDAVPSEPVAHGGDRSLVARDRVGTEDHRVVVVELEQLLKLLLRVLADLRRRQMQRRDALVVRAEAARRGAHP